MKLLQSLLKISDTAACMIAVIGALFLALFAVGSAVYAFIFPFEPPLAFGLGLLLGCILSALKVILLERALQRALDLEGAKAQGYASLQAALRYILTIAALLPVFFFREVFGLFGAIFGILTLQASAYISGRIIGKRDTENISREDDLQ